MSAPLPLMCWKENAEVEKLAEERRALTARIATLPRRSHLRIELTGRLKALTEQQLRLELERDGAETQ